MKTSHAVVRWRLLLLALVPGLELSGSTPAAAFSAPPLLVSDGGGGLQEGRGPTIRNIPELSHDVAAQLPMQLDYDGDGIKDGADNCIETANPEQSDADGDGFGDACEFAPVSVELSTSLAFSSNPSRVNRTVELRVTAKNTGATASGPVTAQVELPEDVRFVGNGSGTPWTCALEADDYHVTCMVDDIAPGAAKTAILRLKPTATGTLSFTVRAESEFIEENPLDNEASADLEVASSRHPRG